jgi:hypothetical protein
MDLRVAFFASRINDEIYFGDVQLIPIAAICGNKLLYATENLSL